MDAAVGRIDVVRRLGEGLRSTRKCGVQARSQDATQTEEAREEAVCGRGKVEGHLTGERLVEDAEEGQRSMRRPHPVRRRVLHSRLCIRLLHDDARNWDVHCRHRGKLGVGREGVGRAALVGERTAQLLAARAEVGRETAGAEDNVLSC